MERIVLLLRESDPRAAEAACASQRHALEKEVARRGGHVVAVVSDLGYSGAILDRPAIDQVLDLAERRQMDVVLATELARFSRAEPAAYYLLRAELERCGVRLEFLDKSWSDDPDDEAAPLLEGIAVALPRMERRRIARRFQRGKERVWAGGFHWAPNPAYGFRYHKGGSPRPDRPAPGRFEIREDEAGWVRHMYRLAAEGWTLGAIGRWLTAQGARTRKDGRWWPKTIADILDNPQNVGLFASRHQAVRAKKAYQARPSSPSVGQGGTGRRQVKSSHTLLPRGSWRGEVRRPELAIVSQDLFDRAAAMRKKNAQTSPRRTREPSLLHGLVVCTQHRDMPRRMSYVVRAGRPPAWRCTARGGPGGPYCSSYAPAERLEAAVWDRVVALATSPDAILGDIARGFAQAAKERERAQRHLSGARAQVQAADDLLDNLALGFYAGDLDRTRYERLRSVAEGRKKEAQAALTAAEEEHTLALPGPLADQHTKEGLVAVHVASVLGYSEEMIRRMIHEVVIGPTEGALAAMSRAEKRRRLRTLVERVVVEESGAYVQCALSGRRDLLVMDSGINPYPKTPPPAPVLRFIVPLGDPEPYHVRSVTLVQPAQDAAHTVGDEREREESVP